MSRHVTYRKKEDGTMEIVSDEIVLIHNNLSDYKQYLISKLDEYTSSKISKGFTFDGRVYSMSLNAQINWSNLLQLPDNLFPLTIMSTSEEPYSLELSRKTEFYLTCVAAKNTPLQQGHVYKQEILALATVQDCAQYDVNFNWSV